jgi:glycosyltransferase involved in cell wall biosynthesis
MRILYLIEELKGGGKERRLVELLKGLTRESNYEIHLVLTKTSIDYPEVNHLPVTIHYLKGLSDLALIYHYFMLLKKLKPTTVHTWSFKTSFYIALLKPFFVFRFITGFIGNTNGFSIISSIIANTLVFRKADIIISNSSTGLTAYKVPVNKGKVIYNGFDPSRLRTIEDNRLDELGINTPHIVVMLANVTQNKNYPLFLEIAETIIANRNDVTFIAIGNIIPKYEKIVERFTDNKHSRIKFLGFRHDVCELIKNCNIGLLCTYTEGISNAIMELMANGIPVITNDLNGGSKELISSGEDGIICSNNAMIDNLELLLNNDDFCKKLSKNASDKILNTFSLKKMVTNYESIY